MASLRNLWRAYAPSVKTYWILFWAMTIIMIVTVATKYVQPFLLRELLMALESNTRMEVSMWWYVAFLAMHVGTWTIFDPVVSIYAAYGMRDAERRTLEVLQRQSARFFGDTHTGSLVTASKRFHHTYGFLTDQYALQFGRIFVMIVFTVCVFSYLVPVIGVSFGAWVVIYLSINVCFALYRMRLEKEAAKADSAVSGMLADTLGNHATVRAFGREADERKRFDALTQAKLVKQLWADIIGGSINRLQGILVVVLEIIVLSVLIGLWKKNAITWMDFVFFYAYLTMAIIQLWEVAGALNKGFKHLGDAYEMADIYALQPEVRDADNAVPLKVMNGAISFESVDFGYEEGSLVLEGFSLDIRPGEMIALVGPSGAGKTTVMNLLMRLYDPNSGIVRIDGQDIAYATQVSVRQQIGLVPQDPGLFHRTIRENIDIGDVNATEADIIAAARHAHAMEFIEKLPKGLDTIVGERGVKLSGGQRQRIALARAFLAECRILALDEATSALDSKTESMIQSSIADLLKNKTSIVIAHRLSTIKKADRIVVMEKGRIVAIGSHEELLSQKNGLYYELWQHQSGRYLVA